MKALIMKVKDFIEALQSKVNKLVATMRVIMMAMEKTPIIGDTPECKGKSKVLEPRPNMGGEMP